MFSIIFPKSDMWQKLKYYFKSYFYNKIFSFGFVIRCKIWRTNLASINERVLVSKAWFLTRNLCRLNVFLSADHHWNCFPLKSNWSIASSQEDMDLWQVSSPFIFPTLNDSAKVNRREFFNLRNASAVADTHLKFILANKLFPSLCSYGDAFLKAAPTYSAKISNRTFPILITGFKIPCSIVRKHRHIQ